MIGIALGGGSVFTIVMMIACYNIGNQFAGESIYKVWTQESFLCAEASMQGFINGFSRFCCGLFALVTPMLVAPERIQLTMYGFAGIVIISAVAGSCMLKLRKKARNSPDGIGGKIMAFTFQINNDLQFIHDEALLSMAEVNHPS